MALLLGAAGCTGAIEGDLDDPGADPGPGPQDPARPKPPGAGGMSGTRPLPGGTCETKLATPPRLWRLTHQQFKNTIVDTFGFAVPVLDQFPAESRLDGYANAAERLGLSSVLFEYYSQAAQAVAAQVVSRSGEFIKCPLAELGRGGSACLTEFLDTFGRKAWRRPLNDEDRTRLTKLYQAAAAGGPELGLATVVQGLVLSANFLFRTELGAAPATATTLTDLELASALSYLLWDAPPDEQLLDLAVAGKLHAPETLAAEARRLLATPKKAPAALHSFFRQWLETEDLVEKPKDMTTHPLFDKEVARQLEAESERFIDEVVFEPGGDRSLRTLLTARHGYLSARTAPIYDGSGGGADLARADLNPAQRRGLLTQASFLAAHAEPQNTSVVGRGRFMREEVLCDDVPPPPGEFKFDPKNITDDMTAREKFIEHSKNPACAACHALFDTIGFALENYDAIGKYRTTEKGKTIDPTGSLALPMGGKIDFKNFVDLIDQLAAGPDVYACFSSQLLQYASGRVELDACEEQSLAAGFADSGYRLDALLMAIVQSPGFVARRN
jgi:hypothetical protein